MIFSKAAPGNWLIYKLSNIKLNPPKKSVSVLCGALISLPLLFSAQSAHATLGGDLASIKADQKVMEATLTSHTEATYSDYTLSLKNGVVVHEFVSAGKVFQVTWSGKGARPNMDQLLGKYTSSFPGNDGVAHRPTERNAHVVRDDLVIHSSVQNRFFSGSAHVPAMLPQGMAEALKVPVEARRQPTVTTQSPIAN